MISSADLHLRCAPCPAIRKRTIPFHNRVLFILFQPALAVYAVCAIRLRSAPALDNRTRKPDRRFLRYRVRSTTAGNCIGACDLECAFRFHGTQTAAPRQVPGTGWPIALLQTTESGTHDRQSSPLASGKSLDRSA